MLTPPFAPRRPHRITQHGQTRQDDYFWLRDRSAPEVLAYLEAENAHTDAALVATLPRQAALYREMRGRMVETDQTVPAQLGAYYYYQRLEAGQQYPIYCRKAGGLDAPETVLLDVNALAAGRAYCRLGVFEISPDQRWLAYSVDFAGDEAYTLRIKDLATGALLPEAIENTYYSLAWAADNATLFYTTLDPALRPEKIWRHTCGTPAGHDTLIHHETDPAFFASVRGTRSQRFILINLRSNRTDEWRYAPADQPEAPFTVFAPRQTGVEYRIDHHVDAAGRERFFILTNAGAQNFQLLETPVAAPAPAHWREVIPPRADVLLDGFDVFRDQLVVYERAAGLQRIRLCAPDAAAEARYVAFPEPAYTFLPTDNLDYTAGALRFVYSSLVTPRTVVDYDWAAGVWTTRKADQIPSGYDPALYRTERITAAAPDGTAVPISLVYRADVQRDGQAPGLLYGYGAYGASADVWFDAKRLSLLERGLVFAIAHVRGGEELGRAWYEDGKLLRKRNTFTDFIACAEHLTAQGYIHPDRLAITGTSAGGLLVGAAVTMRPELFRGVVARVPFVDVLNSMSDPSIPLTVIEWEEWGNPADPVCFEYMRSYSPYDNIQARAYPALLVTAGLNDPRVAYWEPAKFVAKLRALKTDSQPLLLRTNLGAGHGGASGRFDFLKEIALEYAFLLETLGVA
ncbi:MAG: S9 family peptidase [Anaerolineales bacterium]|nr:S9 family peptidase [Anaerolineales bacterium]